MKKENKNQNVMLNLIQDLSQPTCCHAELDSASQTGRSMVEMLGVLAIIGVLSVAGIAGYSTAMNKHRANTLLNEASKRATIVAMQLASGKTAPAQADNTLISEFTDPTGNAFTVSKANDNQFNIEITGVSEAVCQQMKTASGGVIKGFKPDPCEGNNNKVVLTYNNDMSTADLPSGPADVGVCENGNVYLSYNAYPCGTETTMNAQKCERGSDCWDPPGDASCCDTATHTCKTGTYYSDEYSRNEGFRCVEADNKQCTKNSDCASGEFCHLASAEWDCYKPDTGTCEPIGDYTDATVTGLGSVRRSNGHMEWWAAENWCKAQGKSLIDVSKFQVYKTTYENTAASGLLTSGAGTWSYGCADGKKCGSWYDFPFDAMWDENTLDETAGDSDGLYKDRFSPVLISLRQEFDGNLYGDSWRFWTLRFWTASDYDSSDSCQAFSVDLLNGAVEGMDRCMRDSVPALAFGAYALCE